MDKKPSLPGPQPYPRQEDCCDLYGEYCYPCKTAADSPEQKKKTKH